MSSLNTANLLSKSKEEAQKICENYGYILRIASEDGKPYILTCEFQTNRINVAVINGYISSILDFSS